MFTTSFIRRSLTGAAVFAISILLLASTGCKQSKDTDVSKIKQPTTTTEVSTTCTTSTTMSTTTTSTTSSTTTGTTTTTSTAETVLMTQPIEVNQTIAVATEPVYVEPVTEAYISTGYNENDAILMAQVINKEASASYDGKLAVASVIVNRSNYFGQSITDVVYAPNQFSVVGFLGSYTDADYQAAVQVLTNGSVNNAYYFDGGHSDCLNHFRDINNNYIGAW